MVLLLGATVIAGCGNSGDDDDGDDSGGDSGLHGDGGSDATTDGGGGGDATADGAAGDAGDAAAGHGDGSTGDGSTGDGSTGDDSGVDGEAGAGTDAGDAGTDSGHDAGPDAGPTALIHYYGRFDTTDTNVDNDTGDTVTATAAAPVFDWSGSSIVTDFVGSGIAIKLTHYQYAQGMGHEELEIVVDGTDEGPLTITHEASSGDQTVYTYNVVSGLADKQHHVEIYKRNEALYGYFQFYGFTNVSGGSATGRWSQPRILIRASSSSSAIRSPPATASSARTLATTAAATTTPTWPIPATPRAGWERRS